MYRRKKTPRKKARVTHTKRKVKRASVKRRKPMAKRKSTYGSKDQDEVAQDEDQQDEFDTVEGSEQTTDQHNEGEADQAKAEGSEVPVPTETAASDDGVYVVDSDQIAIKSQLYKRGDKVTLTPEELEQVQASGVRILPVG